MPFLLGLTNAQTGEWTDPLVGGLILVGVVLGVVFVRVESRAAEPILPLDLFRNRTVAASIAATFLITFGFFGGIIFIPRWFQFVLGSSATESGYQMLPLMLGVMGSLDHLRPDRRAHGPLQVDDCRRHGHRGHRPAAHDRARGRHADHDGLALDAPGRNRDRSSFAVFTIVVQSAVSRTMLGAATSALTFFRQVGGSVGLALAGTIFDLTRRRDPAAAHIERRPAAPRGRLRVVEQGARR